jgi:flagellar basal body-associated protein FliL
MTANDKTSGTHSSSKKSARLRMIGIIVLVLGIGGAGTVYWLGTRSPDLTDDLSMVGYNKAEQRQMGMLYGKMGPVIDDWLDDLKRPGTQATLLVAVSALIAAGCFYFAPWLDNDDKMD